ncbi:hypothetical protein [Thiothrix subterranea]|uniref:hypothetical protein n=1 Tax=Thiothrix subterranea TaxID=2735563 RepID=UPI00280AEE59|nr:hypothetical protein [Thiothrix subterranea]
MRTAEQSIAETSRHAAEDRTKLSVSEAALADLIPREADLSAQLAFAEERLAEAEDQLNDWQEHWHTLQQHIADPTRQAQVEKVRIEQLERQLSQTSQRLERLQQEASNLAPANVADDVQLLEAQREAAAEELALAEDQLANLSATLSQQQQAQRDLNSQIDAQRSRRQSLQGRLASLETLQQSGLEKTNKARQQWLKEHALDTAPRLAEILKVEAGWEIAFEAVLAADLDASCLKNPSPLTPHPAAFSVVPQGRGEQRCSQKPE